MPKDRTANWVMPSLNISVAQIRVQEDSLLDQQFHVHVLNSHSQMTQETASFGQQYSDKFRLISKEYQDFLHEIQQINRGLELHLHLQPK